MRPAQRIVSFFALVTLAAAIIGQAVIYASGIVYGPDGLPVDGSQLSLAVTVLAAAGGVLSLPLVFASGILVLIATIGDRRYGWLAAVIGSGVLAIIGLGALAWVILSAATPFAFQTPLILPTLVATIYSFLPPSRPDAPPALD
jgi:hypothetical protein